MPKILEILSLHTFYSKWEFILEEDSPTNLFPRLFLTDIILVFRSFKADKGFPDHRC